VPLSESDEALAQEYENILEQLNVNQCRFIVARLEHPTDSAAARSIDIDERTPLRWPEKPLIDRAIKICVKNAALMALGMRRKALPKAMAVKISGLDSLDEDLRQQVAKEIIEGELGRPTQRNENNNKDTLTVNFIWDLPTPPPQT